MSELRPDVIHAWRLSIDAAQIRLGEFNWPWALGMALDEIDRLRPVAVDPTTEDAANE